MSAPRQKKKRSSNARKLVTLSALEASLQQLSVVYSTILPSCEAFATAAAHTAAAAGLEAQVALTVHKVQLSLQPALPQLSASVGKVQVGYSTCGPAGPGYPQLQSVELLLLSGLELRRYSTTQLLLLKAAAQQEVDSFSLLAQGLPPQSVAADAVRNKSAVEPAAGAAADPAGAATGSVPGFGLSSSTSFAFLQQPLQPSERAHDPKRAVLSLEIRLQDVAVQASVCDKDVLLVQLELLKYSSLLEQAVVEKLKFAINDRLLLQIPHLAVHHLPGWLPAGTAAAAACALQRVNSPAVGGSLAAAAGDARHIDWLLMAQELSRPLGSGAGSPERLPASARHSAHTIDCAASCDSVRIYEDGGLQSLHSVDDAAPSTSLGSKRPAAAKHPQLYQRQAARQQAARERCRIPAAAARDNGLDSVDAASGTDRAECGAAGAVIPLDVYAEQILFCVPCDEAPGRIILVCETWAKAVKQVIAAQAKSIKAHLTAIKQAKADLRSTGSGCGSNAKSPAKPKRQKVAYIELVAHVQHLVFSMQQHPLETFMGLHGPLLQRGSGPALAAAAEALGSASAPLPMLSPDTPAALESSIDDSDGLAIDGMPDPSFVASDHGPDDAEHEAALEAEASLIGEASVPAAAISHHEGLLDDPSEAEPQGLDREATAMGRAEAVVLICLPGHHASAAMAKDVITRVDPASEGVFMERFQSISVDVGLQDIVAHFGGVEEMAASIGQLGASGLLIRARQLAAPPQMRPLRMAVGTWHSADVPVVVKGTRPPMKMYTDLKAELDDVQGGFCPGMEAPFGQLNIAFKRLTVPNALNADGSVPPSIHPGLPWWDMMAYMWRGTAAVRVNRLTAILANSQDPHVGMQHPKLELTAATLNVAVLGGGRIDVTSTNMSSCAHAVAPVAMPAFHLPQVTLSFLINAKMPGGRNPQLHHAFPVLTAPPPAGSCPQQLVDVFSLMRCEGWSLAIDIAVKSDRTPGLGSVGGVGAGSNVVAPGGIASPLLGGSSAAGSAAALAAASCWHYFQPYNLPHAYIGEFQIKYIIDMVDTLVNSSAVVKLSRKLKPYYVRDRRPEAAAAAKAVAAVRSQVVPMPQLKQQVDINLTADWFRVHHDAQDSEDPSDMVCVALTGVRYMNTFTYSRIKRTQVLSGGSRIKDGMRQFMASLTVEAFDLKVLKPQADELAALLANAAAGSGAMGQGAWGSNGPMPEQPQAAGVGYGAAKDQLDRVRQQLEPRTPTRAGSSSASPLSASPIRAAIGTDRQRQETSKLDEDFATRDLPGFAQGLIIDAGCFLLRQVQPEAGSAPTAGWTSTAAIPVDPAPVPKRAIRMIAQDVKVLCPAELRDTCILLFHHMQKAFSGITFGQQGPVRISTQKQQQQQAEGAAGSSPMHHTMSGSFGTGLQRDSTGQVPISPFSNTDFSSAEGGATGGGISSGGMVTTLADEDLLLQQILQENRAAAAAAAAAASSVKPLQQHGSGDLATISIGAPSVTAESAAGDVSVGAATASLAVEGSGYAAAATRAIKGHSSARGSLVLGTNNAVLMGHLNPARLERSVSFKMDQVQAHVMCSELDPFLGPLWLEIAKGKLSTPVGAEAIMRQVLLPFKCQLVTTRQAANSATATGLNTAAPATAAKGGSSEALRQQQQQQTPTQRQSSSSGQPPGPAAQELRLHVPTIGARLDSRQFEVLMDVIQNIAMAPLPQFPASIRGLSRYPDGTSEDDDNQDVQYALETLQSLRERQKGLELELAAVLQGKQQLELLVQRSKSLQESVSRQHAPAAADRKSLWASCPAAGVAASAAAAAGGSTGHLAMSLQALGGDPQPFYADIREATTALVLALAKAGAAATGPWQGVLAGSGMNHSSSSSLTAAAAGYGSSHPSPLVLQQSQQRPQRLVSDQLVLVMERQTLIWWAQEQLQGALDAIAASRKVLELLRHEAGLLKVKQRSAMVVSITVDTIDWALSKGSADLVRGELQEEMVRIYADHGALEKHHIVYEHIEVLVNPIRVHLTAALATALQDYFKLKDDDGSRGRPASRDVKQPAPGKAADAARTSKRTVREERRRQTAPGDLSQAVQASATSGKSALRPGPLAPGGLLPTLFSRRQPAQAATPAAAAAAAALQPPTIAVPPTDFESSIQQVGEPGNSHATAAAAAAVGRLDSPAVEVSIGGHLPEAAQPSSVPDRLSEDGSSRLSGSGGGAAADPDLQPAAAASTHNTQLSSSTPRIDVRGHGSSASVDEALLLAHAAAAASSAAPGSSPGTGTLHTSAGSSLLPLSSPAAIKERRQGPVRSIRFKHVRFNRVVVRVTWEGPPLSINNFGLVLDKKVYRNIAGGWKDVLNKYKWDAVESCVRSILGLQSRKLQEVEKQTGLDVLDSLQLRSGSIKTGLVSWFKGLAGSKPQVGGAASYGNFELAAVGSLPEESEGEADQGGVKAQGVGLAGIVGGDTMLGGAAAVMAAAADPLDLVREVAAAKQKAKKVVLLLGSNVPPLLAVPQGTTGVSWSEAGAAGPAG
eukprot:gene10874-11028_t